MAYTTIENLLKMLAEKGGSIVSTGGLSVHEIAQAGACGRMYVDENSLGFVYRPPITSAESQLPTSQAENEELKKREGKKPLYTFQELEDTIRDIDLELDFDDISDKQKLKSIDRYIRILYKQQPK